MADLVRWDRFRDTVALRDVMGRLLEDGFVSPFLPPPCEDRGLPQTGRREGSEGLAMDVYETENELVVESSLPGVKPDEVDISVVGNLLTIKAETKQEEAKEDKVKYHCRERRHGIYRRSVLLPMDVDANKAEAVFENGVLKLTLPRSEAHKPRKIAINKS